MKMQGVFFQLVHFLLFLVVFDFGLASDCLGLQSTHGVEQVTNETIRNLSIDLEMLSIRGSSGYGNDKIDDDGIEHLRRFPKLKVLKAEALGLSDRSVEVISELTHLEELSLASNNLQGSNLHKLRALKKLKKLNISSNPIHDGWAAEVSQWSTLEDLRASNILSPLTDETFVQLSKLTNLHMLELNENAAAITDVGLAAVSKLTRLQSMTLRDSNVTAKGLAQLQSLRNLETLLLGNLRTVSPGDLSWLTKLTNLKRLELDGISMNSQDMKVVTSITSLESLLIWSVSGSTSFTIDRMEGLKSLRSFRTNETLSSQVFQDLSKIETLELLGDDMPSITDVELEWLSRLEKLQTLFLDNASITERSLPVLGRMKSLRHLCVSDQVQITAEQWKKLGKESLPNCKIVSRYGSMVYHEPSL